ncbi:biotin/lipoyl-containing protein [Altererythrobacter sp. C41]|uniref:biotin/lipoyl-containing protein n=1 Tax=Altererythrobacter sp. C41 TaxID=2806021 RepID=UPI0019341329|nr:biotin/lipoyl-containing protein [Altererythrobacter sp. C41]MBM0169723.1 biotin attachment protein [Altererythrobacter sp. C41]
MAVSVELPSISMGVTEATIVSWLKNVGDRVEAGEVIAEVETAKSTVEVESPASGTLASIVVQVDETVDVGTEIATIEEG